MSMWEPFTEVARRAIIRAQEVAERLKTPYIGPAHIFAGIVMEGQSEAAQIAASLGADEPKTLEAARTIIGTGQGTNPSEGMTFTQEAKHLIECSFDEARKFGHRYIGAEHLMMGYLRACKSPNELLAALHVNPEELRDKTRDVLKSASVEGPADRLWLTLDQILERTEPGGDAEQLWQRLGESTDAKDVAGVLAYAFRIARHGGWTAQQTADRINERLS